MYTYCTSSSVTEANWPLCVPLSVVDSPAGHWAAIARATDVQSLALLRPESWRTKTDHEYGLNQGHRSIEAVLKLCLALVLLAFSALPRLLRRAVETRSKHFLSICLYPDMTWTSCI